MKKKKIVIKNNYIGETECPAKDDFWTLDITYEDLEVNEGGYNTIESAILHLFIDKYDLFDQEIHDQCEIQFKMLLKELQHKINILNKISENNNGEYDVEDAIKLFKKGNKNGK